MTEGEPKIENTIEKPRNIENLRYEILGYQYEYIDRLNKGLIQPVSEEDGCNNKNFGKILKQKTFLEEQLGEEYVKRMPNFKNTPRGELRNRRMCFSDLVFSEISFLYTENKDNFRDNWKEKISEIIESKLNILGPVVNGFEEIKKLNNENKPESFGLISQRIMNAGDRGSDYLLRAGFKISDQFINIHFEDLFEQKKEDTTISNLFSADSLSKLAMGIVEKYPQVKGVAARSWLVDSVLGKRIGLTICNKLKKVSGGLGFWGQFIDEKGEIKKEKIQKFIETGIPELYTSEGFIKTEDFLRKCLPEKNKGLIKLKERTQESIDFIYFLNDLNKKSGKDFEFIPVGEIEELLNTNITMANYLKMPNGKEFLALIKRTKESTNPIAIFKEERAKEIQQDWEKYRSEHENIFVDKEVLID